MTYPAESWRAGGEFEIAVADLAVGPQPARPLPGFGAAHELWLDSGRSVLGVIARDLLRRGARPRVWLPAYSCESVATPFQDAGFELVWYGVGESLDRVDADPLRGEVLLFIHYFGRRNDAALRCANALAQGGVWIVEDCVQAPLTPGVGMNGHYAVSSLRKLLPQPDGALLASREPIACTLDDADEAFVSARLAGKLLRAQDAETPLFLNFFEWSERRLDPGRPRRMSWLSEQLLRGADLAAIAARRRRNARLLDEAWSASPRLRAVAMPGIKWSGDEVPFGLPIRVAAGRRDELRRCLAERRVYCPIHWDLGHLPGTGFETERRLSESLLTLPIDQRQDDAGIARIVGALELFHGDLQ